MKNKTRKTLTSFLIIAGIIICAVTFIEQAEFTTQAQIDDRLSELVNDPVFAEFQDWAESYKINQSSVSIEAGEKLGELYTLQTQMNLLI